MCLSFLMSDFTSYFLKIIKFSLVILMTPFVIGTYCVYSVTQWDPQITNHIKSNAKISVTRVIYKVKVALSRFNWYQNFIHRFFILYATKKLRRSKYSNFFNQKVECFGLHKFLVAERMKNRSTKFWHWLNRDKTTFKINHIDNFYHNE